MTLEEAKKVAAIAGTADGGCCYCVGALIRQLQKAFPQFTWTYEDYEEPVVTEADAA